MKKVINGKIYNTETADYIASWDNGMYPGDFGRCDEDLYKTEKGAFFIHGDGGAASRWSEPCGGNGYCGGSGIEVLTKAQALEWCESHDVDADTVSEHFEVQEG